MVYSEKKKKGIEIIAVSQVNNHPAGVFRNPVFLEYGLLVTQKISPTVYISCMIVLDNYKAKKMMRQNQFN